MNKESKEEIIVELESFCKKLYIDGLSKTSKYFRKKGGENYHDYRKRILINKRKIVELDLSGLLLDEFPRWIIEGEIVKHLIKLDLSRNKLLGIPAEIGKLKNLMDLNLLGNPIRKLPESIEGLDNSVKIYWQWLFKVTMLGDTRVGKTAILTRLVNGKFELSYLPTLGVDIQVKEMILENGSVRKWLGALICVDTAGPEFFAKLRPDYYRGSNGCIIVYDITDHQSFQSLDDWYNEYIESVEKRGADVKKQVTVLLGNKLDLVQKDPNTRQVTYEEGLRTANRINAQFYEINLKDNSMDIVQIFKDMASAILSNF